MKTSFKKINNRWFELTEKLVISRYGVEGTKGIDVCSGEQVCISYDEVRFEPTEEGYYKIIPWFDAFEAGTLTGKHNKKTKRAQRINEMCGAHWDLKTGFKRIGKNRRLRRRMWPNKEQLLEYDSYLPF